tara:strand:- start:600 stop:827 length:228 start_codon:yes stop_codon:yes gene_type:complete
MIKNNEIKILINGKQRSSSLGNSDETEKQKSLRYAITVLDCGMSLLQDVDEDFKDEHHDTIGKLEELYEEMQLAT